LRAVLANGQGVGESLCGVEVTETNQILVLLFSLLRHAGDVDARCEGNWNLLETAAATLVKLDPHVMGSNLVCAIGFR
jgi:hypothetical protein